MIRDRLEELKQETKISHGSSSESLCIINDEEVAYLREAENNEDETEFVIVPHSPVIEALLKVYTQIRYDFEIIQENLDTMKNMVLAKNAKEFSETKFFNIRQSSIQIGNNIMSKFQTIEINLPTPDDFSTMARMKRVLYYGLFQKYVQIWTETEQFFQEYESRTKRNLRNQSKILAIELSEEEIETLVSNKHINLYACNILDDTENARKTLSALTERLGDLKKLEKSLEEVHSLFIRLQRLVVEQGVVMQSIEKHFNDAVDFVEVAVEQIQQAESYHKKNVKKKYILYGMSLALLLLVIIIIISVSH